MKKYTKVIAIVLVIAIVGAAGFYAKEKVSNKSQLNTNITFGSVEVISGDIKITAGGSGNLVSSNREEIKSEVKGTINTLNVEVGDLVTEGDILFTTHTSWQEVKAPFSGTITEVKVEEGDKVNINQVILTIVDLDALEVVVEVDELDIPKIEENQEAVITSEVFPSEVFTAKVTKVAYEGKANNGVATFEVALELNEIKDLRPGMTVSIEIVTESKDDVLLLPIEAVQMRGNKNMVMMQNGDETESTMPNMNSVEIGLVSEDYVEIISGLNENDVVVYPKSVPENVSNARIPGMGGMNPLSGGNKQRPSNGTKSRGGGF